MFDRDDDARLKRIEGKVDTLLSERLDSITQSLVRIEAKLDQLFPVITQQDLDAVTDRIQGAATKLDLTANPNVSIS